MSDVSNSKPLGHDDSSGFEFVKEMLNGDPTAGINFDRLQYHPKQGYIIFEWLLCDEGQTVTPYTSHPKRYWGKNKRKFISLWKVTKALNATLYLVNYAKAGTKGADEVLAIKVLDLNESGIQNEEIQKYTRAEFQTWFRKLNNECLDNLDEDTQTTEYKCPNCGNTLKKSLHGYYCSAKCGMIISKIFGTDLDDKNVERLLNGENCEITTKSGIRTQIEPAVVKRYKDGKTYINWKTKNVIV